MLFRSFLICYDVKKDQSKGTNYHKVSEYLVYGRPIVSNYVSAYDFEGSGVIIAKKNQELKKIIKDNNAIENVLINSVNTYSNLLNIVLSLHLFTGYNSQEKVENRAIHSRISTGNQHVDF